MGFEPTIPVFERAKTVHALDRAAAVIGCSINYMIKFSYIVLSVIPSVMLATVYRDTDKVTFRGNIGFHLHCE
jgi:hypothetical protein